MDYAQIKNEWNEQQDSNYLTQELYLIDNTPEDCIEWQNYSENTCT